jgi:hypothetical protein
MQEEQIGPNMDLRAMVTPTFGVNIYQQAKEFVD